MNFVYRYILIKVDAASKAKCKMIYLNVSKKLKPFSIWLRQLKSLLPAAIEFSSIPSVFYQHFFSAQFFRFTSWFKHLLNTNYTFTIKDWNEAFSLLGIYQYLLIPNWRWFPNSAVFSPKSLQIENNAFMLNSIEFEFFLISSNCQWNFPNSPKMAFPE